MSRKATVIAGLDFGTWSTKILVRERNDERAKVLQIGHTRDDESNSYIWFVTPSLMRIDDDQTLSFGRTALRRTGGFEVSSPKLLLSTGRDLSDGHGVQFPHGATADLLMAVYTSRALRLVKNAVTDFYKDAVTVQVNAAAPAKRYGDEMVINRCERIIHAAYQSVFSEDRIDVRQGTRLSSVRDRFEAWLEEPSPTKELRKSRLYAVLPETVGPLVSMLQNPQTENDRMYIAVDVGGGTTEASACYVHPSGESLDCFIDEIFPVGAGQLLRGDSENSAEEIVESLAVEIRRLCAKAFSEYAAGNQMMTDRWRDLTFVMSGGGATIKALENAIRQQVPFNNLPFGEDSVEFSPSKPVQRLHGREVEAQVAPILTCAHGLSVPRQQWPHVDLPEDLTPPDPDEHLDRGPAHHEQH